MYSGVMEFERSCFCLFFGLERERLAMRGFTGSFEFLYVRNEEAGRFGWVKVLGIFFWFSCLVRIVEFYFLGYVVGR